MKIRIKTAKELLATPGVYVDNAGGIRHKPGTVASFGLIPPSATHMLGQTINANTNNSDAYYTNIICWCPWMIAEVIPDPKPVEVVRYVNIYRTNNRTCYAFLDECEAVESADVSKIATVKLTGTYIPKE